MHHGRSLIRITEDEVTGWKLSKIAGHYFLAEKFQVAFHSLVSVQGTLDHELHAMHRTADRPQSWECFATRLSYCGVRGVTDTRAGLFLWSGITLFVPLPIRRLICINAVILRSYSLLMVFYTGMTGFSCSSPQQAQARRITSDGPRLAP
jgi:hypothetical protein